MKTSKKIIFLALISGAFLYNKLINNKVQDNSLELFEISKVAMAKSEVHYDEDGGSFWDRIWDNTFNRDWSQDITSCEGEDENEEYYIWVCSSGDDDTCIDSECYELIQ